MMAGQKRHSKRPRKAALLEVFQMEKRLARKEMILDCLQPPGLVAPAVRHERRLVASVPLLREPDLDRSAGGLCVLGRRW